MKARFAMPGTGRRRTAFAPVFFLYLTSRSWTWYSTAGGSGQRRRRTSHVFGRKDHFGDPSLTIDEAVRALVQQKDRQTAHGARADDDASSVLRATTSIPRPSIIATMPRAAGSRPSWWKCTTRPGARSIAMSWTNVIISARRRQKRFRLKKDFTVSPFMPMELEYDWTFTEPTTA